MQELILNFHKPSGLSWVEAGLTRPVKGRELNNGSLVAALAEKTELSEEEWRAIGVHGLRHDDFIKVADKFFTPALRHAATAQAVTTEKTLDVTPSGVPETAANMASRSKTVS